MTLTRTALGLLAQHIAGDATDPWDAADFSGPADLSISVDGATGRIEFQGPTVTGNPPRAAIYTPLAARSTVFIQTKATMPASAQAAPIKPLAHIQDVDAGAHDVGVWASASLGRWDGTALDEIIACQEHVDGSATGFALVVVPNKSAGTLYRFNTFADGLISEFYDFDGDATNVNTEAAVYASGQVGLGTNGDQIVEYAEWYVMADKDLTVSGLPTGATVEVQDSGGAVLASAAESGGAATIDMHAERLLFPQPAKVVVKDSGGAELASIEPSEGVWGGDSYEFGQVPDQPTCSVAGVTDSTVDLESSAYSHPGGEAHAASQWQVDEAGGNFSAPVYDSGTSADLEAHTATGLPGATDLIARVRHQDSDGDWSEWSASVSFTTAGWSQCAEPSSAWTQCEESFEGDYVAAVAELEPWAHYRLEEASGATVADDQTENERDAVYDPALIDAWEIDSDALAIDDKAISFLSTNRDPPSILVDDYSRGTLTDKETDPNYVAPEFYNNFTIEVWLRCNEATEINDIMGDPPGSGHVGNELTNAKWVLFPAFGGDDNHAGVGFIAGDNGISVFEHGQNHVPCRARLRGPVGQGWRHLFIVISDPTPENTTSTSKVEIYLDGEHGDVWHDRAGWDYTEAGSAFYRQFMGHQWGRSWALSTGNGQAFDGDLSEIVIWDKVLTPSEIESLHSAALGEGAAWSACSEPTSAWSAC